MSIVRNIVKLHGGTVDAASAGVGSGTEIVIRMPRPLPAAAAAVHGPRPLPEAVSRDVLVVDDNEDTAELLCQLLIANGHTVRKAHHAAQAIELFGQRPPDVTLIDIGLPDIDGYALIRRLRASKPAGPVRYVALTGYGLPSDKAKATAAGFDEHVVKPISAERLGQLLAPQA